MCGRYVRFRQWADLKLLLPRQDAAELPPSYNVAPTQKVLVAREHDGKLEGVVMRWGLIPSWAKDKKMSQINARADSAATKPMFRSAFKTRGRILRMENDREAEAALLLPAEGGRTDRVRWDVGEVGR